jgi:PAS domain S-box-containing protein
MGKNIKRKSDKSYKISEKIPEDNSFLNILQKGKEKTSKNNFNKTKRDLQRRECLEAYYRAIIEAFDGLIYICSSDYRIEFMNRQFIDKIGYDATGEYCYRIFHDRNDVCPWCVNERVFNGETIRYETMIPKENRWYYVMNTPVYYKDGTMSKQSLMIDITEKKLIENALKESEDKYRILYENNTSMYFTVNENGIVLSVNHFGAKQLGYSVEELIGTSVLNVFHPEDRKLVNEQFERCFKNPDKVEYREFRKTRKDGSILWVKESACVINRADNTKIMLVVCDDITKRKVTEEELKKNKEELQQRVKELEEFYDLAVGRELRMIEIKKQNEKLRKELERLNVFIDE